MLYALPVIDIKATIDGGSRGNPGPAAIGVALDVSGLRTSIARYIGRATNNDAEWIALLDTLEYAVRVHADRLTVYGDSQLIVKQMNGEWVTNSKLAGYKAQADAMAKQIKQFSINWIPRELNIDADALVNEVLDAEEKKDSGEGVAPHSEKHLLGRNAFYMASTGSIA